MAWGRTGSADDEDRCVLPTEGLFPAGIYRGSRGGKEGRSRECEMQRARGPPHRSPFPLMSYKAVDGSLGRGRSSRAVWAASKMMRVQLHALQCVASLYG